MPSKAPPLLIRCDANARIGTGHLMRCLALAQAWRDSAGGASFLAKVDAPSLQARVRHEGFEIAPPSSSPGNDEDAERTIDMARTANVGWVVLDGYSFGPGYQRRIKEAGLRLLLIDDLCGDITSAPDIVLNQNLHARRDRFGEAPRGTRFLLGSRYVLLRREFRRWLTWNRETAAEARNLVVTMGGADFQNVTRKVFTGLRALAGERLEARLVVGPGSPHCDTLREEAVRAGSSIRIEQNVDDMAGLMKWAHLAISASGTTCWEALFMGLPSILLVLAENQEQTATALHELGVAENLGWYNDVSPERIRTAVTRWLGDPARRARASRQGRETVDGEGVDRLLMEMKGEGFRLRAARAADSKLLWEWANDAETRAASFTPDAIPWEAHAAWFADKLASPRSVLLIAVDAQDTPFGQVRVDIGRDQAGELSISIDRKLRGSGYGSAVLLKAVEEIEHRRGVRVVNAFVKPENGRSARMFQKAEFRLRGERLVKGAKALHFVREPES